MAEEFESEDFLLPDELMGNLGGKTLEEIQNGLIEFAQDFHDELQVKTESIINDFQAKASGSISSEDLQQALQVDIVTQASQANELFSKYYEKLGELGKELDVEALANLQEDIQLFKESLETSTKEYVEGLQFYADVLEAKKPASLKPPTLPDLSSPQEKLQGEGFPVIKPEDIAPEKILANIKSEGDEKARKILERYIRDFEKQVDKKILQIETNVSQFGIKGAPRADTEERLGELVQGMVDKKVSDLKQLGITVSKEFDNIDTRLRTMKGVEEDFDKINSLKEKIESVLEEARGQYEDASGNILKRGKEGIALRKGKKEQKAAVEKAQEEAKQVYESFIEKNRETLQPDFKESLMAVVGQLFPPSTAFGRASDKRYERLLELKSGAKEKADEAFVKSLQASGQDPKKEGMPGFKAPARVPGARLGDIKPLQQIGKFGLPILAATMADAINRKIQEQINDSLDTFSNRETSTMDLANTATFGLGAFGGNVPILGTSGAFVERILKTTETIAANTAKDVEGFSPELINAQIDSSLALMEDNMRRAEELGPMLAGIETSRNQVELAVNRVSDTFLKEFGPYLVAMNLALVDVLRYAEAGVKMIGDIAQYHPIFGPALKMLKDVGQAYLDRVDADVDNLSEIEDFFRPNRDNFRRNRNRLGL